MADYIDIFKEVDGEFKLYDVQSIGEKLAVTIRTSHNTKYNFIIKDFRPYFFVPKINLPYHLPFISMNQCKKITCSHPSDIRKEREKYKYTYEADILYDFRFHFDILLNFQENTNIQPRLWFFDIEVFNNYESSFPKPEELNKFINSIAIYDSYSKQFLTLVVASKGQDCGKVVIGDRTIIKVKSEETLLKFFIELLNRIEPDIIVGWNNILFDIPFLVERLRIKYPDLYNRLSPFGIEPRKHFNMVFNSDEFEIPGYISLDYMLLYQKYGDKLGSYSLESVCRHELGKGKVKYDKSLDYVYENEFDLFIKYNTEDVNLIRELENKLTFIQLVDQLKSITYCKLYTFNFNNTLKVGDMLLMKYIRTIYSTPLVMKSKSDTLVSDTYSGAYVKTPKVGLYYDYIIDFDASSMYPSIIRTLNISPETFVCKIIEDQKVIRFHIRPFLRGWKGWELPNESVNVVFEDGSVKKISVHDLKSYIYEKCSDNFVVAINGSVFRMDVVGVLKYIEDDLAKLREANKNAKKVFGKLTTILKDPTP